MYYFGHATDIGNVNILYSNLHNSCKILQVNNYEHDKNAKYFIATQNFKEHSVLSEGKYIKYH